MPRHPAILQAERHLERQTLTWAVTSSQASPRPLNSVSLQPPNGSLHRREGTSALPGTALRADPVLAAQGGLPEAEARAVRTPDHASARAPGAGA